MKWLADTSPARSAHAAADPLVEKLAALVFEGDADWPDRTDRVASYGDALAGWFAADKDRESEFNQLTSPDADPGALFDWFLPLVGEWEQWAQRHEAAVAPDGAPEDGAMDRGLPNPNSDGMPGTEFYRLDASTGQYLYAAAADSDDWATYEQRRDSADAAAEWDENWAMFYRVDGSGVYEFADAVTPGDRSSGCSGQWLSHEQVLERQAHAAQAAAQPEQASAQQSGPSSLASQRQIILDHIPHIATLVPGFGQLTDEEITEAVKGYLNTIEGS